MGWDLARSGRLGPLALLWLGMLAAWVRADGTESLGYPSVTTAPATGMVVAGASAASGDGTIEVTLPEGAVVNQVLLYWTGFSAVADLELSGDGADPRGQIRPGQESNLANGGAAHGGSGDSGSAPVNGSRGDAGVPKILATTPPPAVYLPEVTPQGDDRVEVDGISVQGTLIGGPTLVGAMRLGRAYRADITALGLVNAGPNSVAVSGVEFTAENDGLGLVVLYDDGTGSAQVTLRDGQDLAYGWQAAPLNATAAQTLYFPARPYARSGMLKLLAGNAAAGRASTVKVTIDGATTAYSGVLAASTGAAWEALSVPVSLPAASSAITVQIEPGADGESPAALAWVMVGLVVTSAATVDCDLNGVPDECDLSCSGLGGDCAATFGAVCGLAGDCNANGQPDACDLVGNDCNANGIPDTCEGAAPPCNDGNACTVGDHCAAGVCIGAPLDCHGLDGTCVVGACNPANGQCRAIPRNTGGACDDGIPCTHDDFCWNGACVGFDPDCSAFDDDCNVGVCNAQTGDCQPSPVNEGGVCDDGSLCTADDACASGVCRGTEPDCSALDGACLLGVCNPATGACETAPANEGLACDDGDACTIDDFCSNGACVAFAADCSALDDACNVGACNAETGLCDAIPANDGGICDDGDDCTVDDRCNAGACAGSPKDCSALDSVCVTGVCLGTTGICTVAPTNEGGVCDDGNGCSVEDACAGGLCRGVALDCAGLDDACNEGVCAGTNGVCATVPANEGGACDDGDRCTLDDSCASGVCAGEPLDCSALDSDCTVGVCDPATGLCVAVATAEGGACDDGDACTVADTCVAGACVGTPKDCSAFADACNSGVCVGTTGLCAAAPTNEGGACDDGDACTAQDACTSGVCSGAAVDCSALSDACHIGVCTGTDGLCEAQPANDGATCDDGDACTTNDSCAGGACAGVPVDCSALDDACNLGACDPLTGACAAIPAGDGGGCDDGDPCTVNDTCANGVCGGEPMDCSALDDACNVGVCDAGSGACVAEPRLDGTACDDGDGCTVNDACVQGSCTGAIKDCSAAGDACHVGVCVGTSGVCAAEAANDGGACDDGDACTVSDTCAAGACAGEAVDCSALDDACNAGVCVGSNGACDAVAVNEAGTCDDGDRCTMSDTCSNGTCAGTPVDCSALDDACNLGVCDPATGLCLAAPANEGGACDDGDPCTHNDSCSAGVCAGAPLDCSALDDACSLGVCDSLSGACTPEPRNNGGGCDDGDACTVNDACSNGFCAGEARDCSALDDACHVGVCDAVTGACVAEAAHEGGVCDDANPCTVNDVCSIGVCAGAAKDCSALDDDCNVGVCDAGSGACVAAPAHEGEACDDGIGCTVDDTCAAGVCGGAPMVCAGGMSCDESRAACVAPVIAGRARSETTQKGSLMLFPKVELRWDSAGNLVQDTFLTLTNDYPEQTLVQMYFVNGDAPAAAVTLAGATVERPHPGWNHIDVGVVLTSNQPTYWSAATGLPIAGGVPPWTILDPGLPAGRPDPERPGERMLRGYVIAWAVDNVGAEVRWNHLSGSALTVDYAAGTAWEYQAYAFQIRNALIGNGKRSGTPGELRLDGQEYDQGFDLLEFDFFATGAAPLGRSGAGVAYDTDLTLLPLSVDLRQEGAGPVATKASLTVWNQNEVKLTGLDRCVTCWDELLFTNYGIPNHLLQAHLQTDQGRAQINGLASQRCDRDYDSGDGIPLGGDPRDVVSVSAALGGVAVRQVCFGASGCDAAGETLGGAGVETATIRVDFIGSLPPERPDSEP